MRLFYKKTFSRIKIEIKTNKKHKKLLKKHKIDILFCVICRLQI